jgi:acyl dehydratase
MKSYEFYTAGEELPPLELPPISRFTLALYCGGSGDHNPVHVDSDYARGHGLSDIFAHGMLSMAYLGRLLTEWAPQSALRSFDVRFTSITNLHDVVSCTGRVVEKFEAEGEQRLRLEVGTRTQSGQTLTGGAVVAIEKH